MFKKMCFIAMFFMLFATGCVQTSFTEFSLNELEEFQYGATAPDMITTTGWIVFEVASEKEFNKSKGFLMEIMSKYFVNPQHMTHSKQGSKDLVAVQVDVPIIRTMNDDLTTFYYIYNNDALYFKMSPQKLSQLNSELQTTMDQGLNKVRDLLITLSIHNDGTTPIKYTIPNIFKNNVPTFGDRYEMAIGEKFDLTLTNFQVERSLADPIEIFKM